MDFINLLIDWNWCSQEEILNIIKLVRTVVDLIRYAVPIALIIMTTIDILQKVINPNEKEGQQKILRRLLASLIVFLIPTIINLTLKVVDISLGNNLDTGINACWR